MLPLSILCVEKSQTPVSICFKFVLLHADILWHGPCNPLRRPDRLEEAVVGYTLGWRNGFPHRFAHGYPVRAEAAMAAGRLPRLTGAGLADIHRVACLDDASPIPLTP